MKEEDNKKEDGKKKREDKELTLASSDGKNSFMASGRDELAGVDCKFLENS